MRNFLWCLSVSALLLAGCGETVVVSEDDGDENLPVQEVDAPADQVPSLSLEGNPEVKVQKPASDLEAAGDLQPTAAPNLLADNGSPSLISSTDHQEVLPTPEADTAAPLGGAFSGTPIRDNPINSPPANVGPGLTATENELKPASTGGDFNPTPTTPAPTTPAPITPAPITPAPITPAPITPAPITPAPITPAPITPALAPIEPTAITPVDPFANQKPTPVEPTPATIDSSNVFGGSDSNLDISDSGNTGSATNPDLLATPDPMPTPAAPQDTTPPSLPTLGAGEGIGELGSGGDFGSGGSLSSGGDFGSGGNFGAPTDSGTGPDLGPADTDLGGLKGPELNADQLGTKRLGTEPLNAGSDTEGTIPTPLAPLQGGDGTNLGGSDLGAGLPKAGTESEGLDSMEKTEPLKAKTRTWKARESEHEVRGEFLGMSPDSNRVRIRTATGVVSIATPLLSNADQGYLLAFKHSGNVQPLRVWSTSDGEYSLEAEFVSMAESRVKLQHRDGRMFTVPANRLSELDRGYLEALLP